MPLLKMVEIRTFHWAGYAVFGATLLISALIGIYYRFTGERQSTTREFLLGGKQMKSIPVALSLQASFMSAISILEIPAEIYLHGIMYVAMIIAYFAAFPLAAHVFVPFFHRQNLTSAYEVSYIRSSLLDYHF